MMRMSTASRFACAAKKIGVGALLVSLLATSMPAYAQTPATPPSPAPGTEPATPPESAPIPTPATPAPAEGVVPPAETPAPPVTPAPPPFTSETLPPYVAPPSKVPSYILWAVGGASLVFGAAFGIAAVSAETNFNDNPTYDKADSVHSRAIAADVGLGLGVILLATGTIFYLVREKPAGQGKTNVAPVAKVRVDPIIGSRSGGGAFTLRF